MLPEVLFLLPKEFLISFGTGSCEQKTVFVHGPRMAISFSNLILLFSPGYPAHYLG